MHRSNASGRFPAFSQLEASTEAGSSPESSMKEWSSQLRFWHTQQQQLESTGEVKATGRKTNSKYKKRPVAPDNPLPLQRVARFFTSSSSRPVKRQAVTSYSSEDDQSSAFVSIRGLESDESALQFQWMHHGGHARQAALACLAEWTRGRACRTIRRRRQQSDSAMITTTTTSTAPMEEDDDESKPSFSWYDAMLDSPVAVSGDYRDAVVAIVKERSASASSLSDEELQATWKAVLACAEACLEQVKLKESPVYLSSVLHFLQQAAQLPAPETVFAATTAREIDAAMGGLVEAYIAARGQQALLLDLWGEEGVDVDVIRKQIEAASVGLILDELDEMKRQVNVVLAWQKRLEEAYGQCNTMDEASDRNDLLSLERMLLEGRTHGFRCKGMTALEQKIERAYSLRDRILRWKSMSQGTRETVKFVAALVRDIHRLKIRFPVVNEMLLFHQAAESWVERANIAIRSRISLDEIKTLIERGLFMPLDLKEFLEKLQSRVAMASEWLDSFEKVIPCPQTENGVDKLELIRRIRTELDESSGHYSVLYELATAGSRIPVEIDCVKLLHVELDARAWSFKAKKWIPEAENDEGGRRGKLEDLREHVSKASLLRDRLALSSSEKNAWVLDYESELSSIVHAADEWIDEHQSILDGDHDDAYTIQQLRKIVQEGNSIYANIGSGAPKFSRMLAQAESWYDEYYPLFVRCNIRGTAPANSVVQLKEIKAAVSVASSDVALPLKEAEELKKLVKKIEIWLCQASLVSGQKRQARGNSQVFTMDDLISLIDEAKTLPVNTEAEVAGLQQQCRIIKEWQLRSVDDLANIQVGFRYLREAINETYGPASEYKRDQSSESQGARKDPSSEDSSEADFVVLQDSMDCDEEKKSTDETSSQCDATVSTVTSEQDMYALANLGSGDCNIHLLIKSFCNDSKFSSCIVTPETETAAQLKIVARWCLRSLKYIENQQSIFDKRLFGAFDRIMTEGKGLLKPSARNGEEVNGDGDDSGVMDRLRAEWANLVSDQLERLAVLFSDRNEYVAWCKKADQLLNSDDRRPNLEKLNELEVKSRDFPAVSDLVVKVRTKASQGTSWAEAARRALSSVEKMSLQAAKTLFTEGDEIGFMCDEMKILRNGLKAARTWSNRVKRCKVAQGEAPHTNVQSLLEEHKSLIVDMSDEAAKLQGALTNYCLCRRPYEGFMIACDECEDWFHGPCIGISESRADRVSKYVCLRCSLSKTYKASALACVDVIRKWINKKELKRVRQVESQKHKRRVRKEKKDIERAQEENLVLRQHLDLCSRTDAGVKILHGVNYAENDSLAPVLENGKNGRDLSPNNSDDRSTLNGTEHSSIVNMSETVSNGDDSSVYATESANKEASSKYTVNCSDVNDAGNASVEEETAVGAVSNDNLTKEEIHEKLKMLSVSVQNCFSRLKELTECVAEQKRLEDTEDRMSARLRSWVLRVRALVLVPSTIKLAALSMPKRDGSFSDAMLSVAEDAKRLGLHELNDVKAVLNCFGSMSWCLRAISIFARQPSSSEIASLVDQASSIELPDEKAIRIIKSMAQRVMAWENRVEKALTPIPGEGKPFNLDALKLYAAAGDDIPVCMPLEQRLATVIDDDGCRHCLCGGPSDGRFMVGCDQCDLWFHGHCVNVGKNTPHDDLTDWRCPACEGGSTESINLHLDSFHDMYDVDADDSDSEDGQDVSSKAPDPDRLWPPFGLFGSETAREILGEEICAIPDCLDPLIATAAAEPSFATTDFASDSLACSSNSAIMGFGSQTISSSIAAMGFGSLASNSNTAVLGFGSQASSSSSAALGFGSQAALFLTTMSTNEVGSTQAMTQAMTTNTTPSPMQPMSIAEEASLLFGVAGGTAVPMEADAPVCSMLQTSAPF